MQLPASAEQPQLEERKGPRARPRDSAYRQVLSTKVAEGFKKKAEAKFEAELEAKLRLEISERKGFL